MRVLIIKTSSLGDVIHTLPAITDAVRAVSDIKFDWVVEEAFAEVPAWHPAVERVIPVALRKWRHDITGAFKSGALRQFFSEIRQKKYSYIIDAQGLFFKSGILALASHGLRCGYDWKSARDPFASLCYQKKVTVSKDLHAITRIRQLFAAILQYPLPTDEPDFGIAKSSINQEKNIVFVHGTTRADKCWAEANWIKLAELCKQHGYKVLLPWNIAEEKERAERIAKESQAAQVLAKMNLTQIRDVLAAASAVVAVDTGLGHLAAALDKPVVSIYGPTDPKLIGTWGKHATHLARADVDIEQVWPALMGVLLLDNTPN